MSAEALLCFYIPIICNLRQSKKNVPKDSHEPTNIGQGHFLGRLQLRCCISGLLRSGFTNQDIDVLGILEGHDPAVHDFLLAMGLPSEVVTFYSDCFDDGGVLVGIHVTRKEKEIAVELLKLYGGEAVLTTISRP